MASFSFLFSFWFFWGGGHNCGTWVHGRNTRNYSSHSVRSIRAPRPSALYCWAQLVSSEHEAIWKLCRTNIFFSSRVYQCMVLSPYPHTHTHRPQWKMPSCFSMILFSRILNNELWKGKKESVTQTQPQCFSPLSWNLMYIILTFNCFLQYLNPSHATVYCYKINTRLSSPHLLFRICARASLHDCNWVADAHNPVQGKNPLVFSTLRKWKSWEKRAARSWSFSGWVWWNICRVPVCLLTLLNLHLQSTGSSRSCIMLYWTSSTILRELFLMHPWLTI